MSEGYCLGWTLWRLLLHPFKALKVLMEATDKERQLEKRLAEALDLLETQRKECARLTIDNASMSRRLAECEFELSRTRSDLGQTRLKLEDANNQLAEHKSVDEKLAEFNLQLSKTEELKRSYDKRIAELESRLADAKLRLKEADDRELLDSIDMHAPARPVFQPQKVTRKISAPTPPPLPPEKKVTPRQDDDWLMELPDF